MQQKDQSIILYWSIKFCFKIKNPSSLSITFQNYPCHPCHPSYLCQPLHHCHPCYHCLFILVILVNHINLFILLRIVIFESLSSLSSLSEVSKKNIGQSWVTPWDAVTSKKRLRASSWCYTHLEWQILFEWQIFLTDLVELSDLMCQILLCVSSCQTVKSGWFVISYWSSWAFCFLIVNLWDILKYF